MQKISSRRAVDCHVHIVGPACRFPQVEGRAYTAPLATVDSLLTRSRPLGVCRYVLVQPSFYGLDNSCILEALGILGEDARAVVVIDPASMTAAQIEQIQRRGVCGVRINSYSKFNALGTDLLEDSIAKLGTKLPPSGWHLEILASLPGLLRARNAIARAKVPIVIDHFGLPHDTNPGSDAGKCLLEIVSWPHVWIKLSAPYRFLPDPLATRGPSDWLTEILRVAPDRCLWGSDWPHTPAFENQKGADVEVPYRALEYSQLLSNFVDAVPDTTLAERILFDNPARLYGFLSASNGQKRIT